MASKREKERESERERERDRERERERERGHKQITHSVIICTRMPMVRSDPLFWSSQAIVATLHSDL